MSNSSLFSRRTAAPPTVPRGDVLGEYESYVEAQKVVDRLAKAEFAVAGMAIVGSELMTVERITGRLSYGRAAFAGAASGSWLGLFFGLLLFLFSPAPEVSFILAAAVIGAGFGMIFGIVSYTLGRRRRDFSSTHQVLASTYRIIIDPNQTARARQALAGGSAWPPLPAQPSPEPAKREPAESAQSETGSSQSAQSESGSSPSAPSNTGSPEPTPVAPEQSAPTLASPDGAPAESAPAESAPADEPPAGR